MTTETLGYSESAGSPGAPYQRCTAWNAGFLRRSRSTSPKAQLAISQPPVCHSSVNEKTTVPAAPISSAVRTCHDSVEAWTTSPSRIESIPNSVRTSGRSPARVCSRERYFRNSGSECR